MSFQLNPATNKNWARWLVEHREILRVCGLPPAVIESEQNWQNFLIDGYLDRRIDPTHFSINELSDEQKELLKNCLEAGLSVQEKEISVLWLRLQPLAEIKQIKSTDENELIYETYNQ